MGERGTMAFTLTKGCEESWEDEIPLQSGEEFGNFVLVVLVVAAVVTEFGWCAI